LQPNDAPFDLKSVPLAAVEAIVEPATGKPVSAAGDGMIHTTAGEHSPWMYVQCHVCG